VVENIRPEDFDHIENVNECASDIKHRLMESGDSSFSAESTFLKYKDILLHLSVTSEDGKQKNWPNSSNYWSIKRTKNDDNDSFMEDEENEEKNTGNQNQDQQTFSIVSK